MKGKKMSESEQDQQAKKDPETDDAKPKVVGRGTGAKATTATPQESEKPSSDLRDVTKSWTARALETKKVLDSQPLVEFHVPLEPGENPNSMEIVNINGYQFEIRKGWFVKIPKQVAEILANKYNVARSAGSDKLIDRDPGVENALSD